MALCLGLSVAVGCRFGGDLARRGQFHADQFAYAALFHGHAVKHIRLCNRPFIVRHDDELTLGNEPLKHADKAVNVAFIEWRIDFVENAKRARPHHVNRE